MPDISDEMNTILDDSFKEKYGLEITEVAIADMNLTEASRQRVNKIDDATIFSNKDLQSGHMVSASADAMKAAASNEAGAMNGFIGMNMASQAGANIITAVNESKNETQTSTPSTEQSSKFCSNCGAPASGNFCSKCGNKLN